MSNIESTQMIDRSQPGPVQIAGYTLESRLGIGGYGEVWRAIGPGGLPKAVKMLFGQMDGPQADAELKSLELMRELRHPFLLSIERIEVVEGRLVVVTELADGCLEDRFQELRKQNQKGIPRDELLGYLRDTADALDFMIEEHGLQHLDIKPENLMLQGKHVKVGDFGLAKNVNVTNMSLVGGFTPLYAAPEIYEGQPSRSSDQYSLAIVYQTMLTGVPPFAGRTAAQLTAQHLNSAPDLSALQPVDRPVIARALSKNPSARFPGCRQFVDELTKRRNARRSRAMVPSEDIGPSTTEVVDASSLAATQNAVVQETQPLAPNDTSQAAVHRPTVYIALGGLGGHVVRSIREHFATTYGPEPLAAFPVLYFDSDRRAISASLGTADRIGLSESEVLPIPLRTSKEYRSDTEMNLKWLSRRWLFNLPRSGEVEGIRPLGRLALMDGRKAVQQRIRDAFTHAVDLTSIEDARERGLKMGEGLDVVLVGSIAGGTASGGLLDLAVMVRDALDHLNIENASISGILLHGTSSQREIGDIQEANTISCLKELRHRRTPGLELEDPFDHTYVVHLGDSLTSPEFTQQAGRIADYLFATTATETRSAVEHWRHLELVGSGGANHLRTFGFASVEESVFDLLNREARSVCYALAQKWSAKRAESAELGETRRLLLQLGLSEGKLSESIMKILRGAPGTGIEHYAQSRSTELAELSDGGCADLFAAMEKDFRSGADPRVEGVMSQVRSGVPCGHAVAADQLSEHLEHMLDQPGRLDSASIAALELRTQLEKSLAACQKLLDDVDKTLSEVTGNAIADAGTDDLKTRCHQFGVIRFYQEIYRWYVNHVGSVLEGVTKIEHEIDGLRTSMRTFASRFLESGMVPTSQPEPLVDAFDHRLLTESSFRLADLCHEVTESAALAALQSEAEVFMLENLESLQAASGCLKRGFPRSASPELPNIGGGLRVLATLPETACTERWMEKLSGVFGPCVSVRKEANATELAVLCEVENILLETILTNFRHKNARIMEVASRVHTRVDIEW